MTQKPILTTTEFIAELDREIEFIEKRIILLESQRLHGWILTYQTHLQSFKRLREAWAKIQKDEYRNEIYFK